MRCRSSLRGALLALVVPTAIGCAGAPSKAAPAASTAEPADAGGPAADAAPSEPPFASSAGEATSMIAAAVDSRGREISACVREFRTRKNLLHERVSVSFGVDQDGKLLGVTSKGKEDAELKGCVQRVLSGAVFPRSRAGVITVTKTYEDRIQERPQ